MKLHLDRAFVHVLMDVLHIFRDLEYLQWCWCSIVVPRLQQNSILRASNDYLSLLNVNPFIERIYMDDACGNFINVDFRMVQELYTKLQIHNSFLISLKKIYRTRWLRGLMEPYPPVQPWSTHALLGFVHQRIFRSTGPRCHKVSPKFRQPWRNYLTFLNICGWKKIKYKYTKASET